MPISISLHSFWSSGPLEARLFDYSFSNVYRAVLLHGCFRFVAYCQLMLCQKPAVHQETFYLKIKLEGRCFHHSFSAVLCLACLSSTSLRTLGFFSFSFHHLSSLSCGMFSLPQQLAVHRPGSPAPSQLRLFLTALCVLGVYCSACWKTSMQSVVVTSQHAGWKMRVCLIVTQVSRLLT